MSTKFLVPLDGSKLAEMILPFAEVLADKTDKQVELLRCDEPLTSEYLVPDFLAPDPTYHNLDGVTEPSVRDYLQLQIQDFKDGRATALGAVGEPARAILGRCHSGEIEWVLMSSHGSGGAGRWLLGSVPLKVVRASPIPSLIVQAGARNTWSLGPRKILVCFDGSEIAKSALPHALKLARVFGSSVTLFQAVFYEPLDHPDLEPIISAELGKAQRALEEIRDAHRDVDITVKTKAINPEEGILEQARHFDLVVMSSHGRTGFKRWLLGSITERIVQRALCPVLVIPKDL